jgi:adenylate cyclase class 1
LPKLAELSLTRPAGVPTITPVPSAGPAADAEAAFRAYNRYRRSRLESQIGRRGVEALRLLPLLLHVDQPGLPGFVGDPACAVGIADYSPSNADFALARRVFPRSRAKRSGIFRPVVDLVAVMGSAGTIGFSGESDLDVWVCHNRPEPARELRLYREKVRAVETWLNKQSGLEIHLFLQATERIRSNDFGDTDVEGCGSAMGALLKEEFYRTGILVAGKAPFWWLVPPEAGPEVYEESIDRLRAEPSLSTDGFVDLGWVARVPLGELFGAAVWQIVKGWKSPFKSSLKMGLLEKAVCSRPENPPLCEILKGRVLAGERTDPYRLLFEEVLAHYRAGGETSTEDLLARCFYLKTGIRLDPADLGCTDGGSGDEAVLSQYVRHWGWGLRRIRHLNEFGRWRFEWVQALGKEVDRYFLRTYKRIRSVLDESGETQRITARDLTLLGRKLQALYRRAPYKVETLHLLTGGVEETSLSLYQETLPDGEAPWRLYRGRVTPFNVDESEEDILRSGSDAIELLIWAAQNKILGTSTRLLCRSVDRELSAADAESLAQHIVSFVRQTAQSEPKLTDLPENPRRSRLLIVPNLGLDPTRVKEVGVAYNTTWGELFYRRWAGPDAFRSFAVEVLLPFLIESPAPDAITVFARAHKVGGLQGPQRWLQRELPALSSFLGGRTFAEGLRRRHVGWMPEGYFVLERFSADEGRHREFADDESLLRYLSGVGPYRSVETRVESHSGDLAVLKAVVESSTPGAIDVYTLRQPEHETLFVVDEIGNLIHFPHALEGEPYALAKLLIFLDAVTPELATQPESPLAGRNLEDALRIHTLVYEGTCRAYTATHEHLGRVRDLGLQPVGLTIERTDPKGENPGGYRITWGSQVIRSGEVPNPLEEVRRRILEARRSGLDYDVFVTRLFLDERFSAQYCGAFACTGHYLFYKKAIEQRLSS